METYQTNPAPIQTPEPQKTSRIGLKIIIIVFSLLIGLSILVFSITALMPLFKKDIPLNGPDHGDGIVTK